MNKYLMNDACDADVLELKSSTDFSDVYDAALIWTTTLEKKKCMVYNDDNSCIGVLRTKIDLLKSIFQC